MVARENQHSAFHGGGLKPVLRRLSVGLAWGSFALVGCAPSFLQGDGTARLHADKDKQEIAVLEGALAEFRIDAGRYPTQAEGLNALRTAPAGIAAKQLHEPYLDLPVPLDSWGHPFVYKYPGDAGRDSYIVESYGKAGVDGDPGNIIGGSGPQ